MTTITAPASVTPEQINRVTKAAAITESLVAEAHASGGTPPETGEQFTRGMKAIIDWLVAGRATEARALQAADLAETLVNNYPGFRAALHAASATR